MWDENLKKKLLNEHFIHVVTSHPTCVCQLIMLMVLKLLKHIYCQTVLMNRGVKSPFLRVLLCLFVTHFNQKNVNVSTFRENFKRTWGRTSDMFCMKSFNLKLERFNNFKNCHIHFFKYACKIMLLNSSECIYWKKEVCLAQRQIFHFDVT